MWIYLIFPELNSVRQRVTNHQSTHLVLQSSHLRSASFHSHESISEDWSSGGMKLITHVDILKSDRMRARRPVSILCWPSVKTDWKYSIAKRYFKIKKVIVNSVVMTVPVDGLAPLDAKASSDTVMKRWGGVPFICDTAIERLIYAWIQYPEYDDWWPQTIRIITTWSYYHSRNSIHTKSEPFIMFMANVNVLTVLGSRHWIDR